MDVRLFTNGKAILLSDTTTIGRESNCDIKLTDAGVSKRHCQISIVGKHISINDLNSNNGTFVNDRKTQNARLHDGDVIRVGPTKFTVCIEKPSWGRKAILPVAAVIGCALFLVMVKRHNVSEVPIAAKTVQAQGTPKTKPDLSKSDIRYDQIEKWVKRDKPKRPALPPLDEVPARPTNSRHPTQTALKTSLTPSEIAAKVKPSVVLIVTTNEHGNRLALGSGFAVVRKNWIVTNYHVIEGAFGGYIKGDSKEYKILGCVGMDQRHDLAVLEVQDLNCPILQIAPSLPQIGADIYVMGNPLGLEATFSSGLVSSVRKKENTVLQITAPISHGSSGGPVLDKNAAVVGVAFAAFSEGQNLNFAICSSDLLSLLRKSGTLIPLHDTAGSHDKTLINSLVNDPAENIVIDQSKRPPFEQGIDIRNPAIDMAGHFVIDDRPARCILEIGDIISRHRVRGYVICPAALIRLNVFIDLDASQLVTGQRLDILDNANWQVVGTESYVTVTHARLTLYVIRQLDISKYLEADRIENERKANERKRDEQKALKLVEYSFEKIEDTVPIKDRDYDWWKIIITNRSHMRLSLIVEVQDTWANAKKSTIQFNKAISGRGTANQSFKWYDRENPPTRASFELSRSKKS